METTLRLFCDVCLETILFHLVDARNGWEVYQCPKCKCKKSYKVEYATTNH